MPQESLIISQSPMDDAHKRALVIAYYLSRFDKKGFQALGFAVKLPWPSRPLAGN